MVIIARSRIFLHQTLSLELPHPNSSFPSNIIWQIIQQNEDYFCLRGRSGDKALYKILTDFNKNALAGKKNQTFFENL